MSTRLDWSDGPIPCAECGRPMRPSTRRASEPRWQGTVSHGGSGRCCTCRRQHEARTSKSPSKSTGKCKGKGKKRSARLDWSDGPVPCKVCGRPMRPSTRRASEPRWQGTVSHGGSGRCCTCRRQHEARTSKSPSKSNGPGEAGAAPQAEVVRPSAPSLRRLAGLDTGGLVASPSLGREVVWPWRMLPGDISLVQQEIECLAVLADQLRAEGLVAMSRPRRSVQHGREAVIVLTLTVRVATPAEAKALGHESRLVQDDAATPSASAERVGVAA